MGTDQTFTKESISAFAAQVVSGACIERTIDAVGGVAVVVLDLDGLAKVSVRMDDVPAYCLSTATERARAVLMTEMGAAPVPDSGQLPGARVLHANGHVVGAVGVSGLRADADSLVAEAGAHAMDDLTCSLDGLVGTHTRRLGE